MTKTKVLAFIRKYTMLIVLVLVSLFFTWRTNGRILMPQNITNIISQNAYVFILATGMLLCILTGVSCRGPAVYVAGQVYIAEDGWPWHLIIALTEHGNTFRSDMLRMMNAVKGKKAGIWSQGPSSTFCSDHRSAV